MKFLLLTILSGLSLTSLNAQENSEPVNAVQQYANELMRKVDLEGAAFSFYVKDLNSGSEIADYNGKMIIPSASTMKLVTTATAYRVLGSNYHFETKLYHSGILDTINGILNGDIYLVGGGDPTLGSKYFTNEGEERDFFYAWIDTIKSAGIKSINGRIIADGSKYQYDGVPAGWVWGDLGNYYGAGPSGLTIFDNLCKLEFKTGQNAGDSTDIICTDPYVPGLTLLNNVKSANSNSDNAYVYGAPYSYDWYIEGSIPKRQESFIVKASIPDPEFIAGLEFQYALENAGITVRYKTTTMRELIKTGNFKRPELTHLYTHESPSLNSIINWVNQYSVNLFAEHLLCEIGFKATGTGSTYQGANYCMRYWKDKIGSGLEMTDGSGLSRSNGVSAKFLVELLNLMDKSSNSNLYRSSMAVAGKKGTMSSIGRGTSAAGRVIGKSGTMSRIKSYAGYVNSKSGKKLAFAMIINNHNCSNSQMKKYFQYLMVKMANY